MAVMKMPTNVGSGGNENIETGTCNIVAEGTVTLPKKPVFFMIANDNNKEYRIYDNRQGNEVLYTAYSSNNWASGTIYPRSNAGVTYDNDKTFTIKTIGASTTGTGWWIAVYSI